MKQGALLNRIMMLVLFGAIVIYLGVYAWDALADPFTTVTAYSCTVDDAMEATGFLAREEKVIQGASAAVVDQLFSEGEKVARGQTVAVLYSSTAAADRRGQLQALEAERDQLQYAWNKSGDVSDNARLSAGIIQVIAALRGSVAAEDFTRLEDQTMELKGLVYQRADTYSGEDGGAAAAQAQLESLNSQIAALQSQSAADTTRVAVEESGVFSGQVDGYEALLTPEGLEALTPADLDRLAAQKPAQDAAAVGKLITGTKWYFVCPLSEEEAGHLTEGGAVKVRFSRDWAGEVSMKVERIGPPQDGRMTVILSSTRFLSDTTLLRRQTVDLVFSSKSGIRVPKNAIRVVTETGTGEESGQTVERQVTGVYALVGAQAEFKPVEILDQRDDYCVVRAVSPDDPKAARKDLRAGDEIIVAGRDLFDGKVIR